MTPHEFREQYYGKQPLLIRGRASKFAGLFNWDDLNRLLNSLTYPHPQVRVARKGSVNAPAGYVSLIEQCRDGGTLSFNEIHLLDPKINEFVRALEADTGESVLARLYLSQPENVGYGKHYDPEDVFIIHLDGYKHWSVFESTIEKPIMNMNGWSHDAPAEPILDCELAPGDVLYIPRGNWHAPVAQREMSMHLTFAFTARTGIDFLTWLVDELREDPRYRHELPLSFSDEPPEVRNEHLRLHIAKLAEIVTSKLRDDETVREYSKYCVLNQGNLRRFNLPAQLFENPVAQFDIRHFSRPVKHRFLLENGPADSQIELSVRGHIFHFPQNARPLITFVMRETDFTYEDAVRHAGELTETEIHDVLDVLVREGVVDAADAPRSATNDVTRRTAFERVPVLSSPR